MSDYGLFEADLVAQHEPQRKARVAANKLANAIDTIKDSYGDFLLTASGKDEFEDRWHYMKADIRKSAEDLGCFPNTGTMRRIHDALKRDFKAEIEKSDDNDGDATKEPKGGKNEPTTITDKQKEGVDSGNPDKVHDVDTNSGDGSDASGNNPNKEVDDSDGFGGKKAPPFKSKDASLADQPNQHLQEGREVSDADLIPDEYNDYDDNGEAAKVQQNFTDGGDSGRAARKMAIDLYRDFAEANGLRVASRNTLEHYTDTGISDSTYFMLANYITAGDDCPCEDDEDDSGDDSSTPSPPQKSSDSDSSDDSSSDDSDDSDGGDSDSDSDSSDGPPESGDSDSESSSDADGDEAPSDDGGSENPFADDSAPVEDSGFDGPPEGPDLGPEDDAGPPAPEEGGDVPPEAGGDFPDAAGPGEQFAIPEEPPQLAPEEQGMIPQDDTAGDAAIPPEVIDEILGLPPGTVESLVVQELGGGPSGPPPGPPQQQVARRRQGGGNAQDGWNEIDESNGQYDPEQAARNTPVILPRPPSIGKPGYRKRAAEDDESGGGGSDPSGGSQAAGADPAAAAPAAPAAPGTSTPSAQPGAPAVPGPDNGALLDQAGQAVTQLVDQKTQEYQIIIDPLQQAIQAIEFAKSVEQAANPLDVTPPEGTVDVNPQTPQPGQAPPAPPSPQQPANPLMQQAAKIADHYGLSRTGHKMVIEAIGRKHYEHVADAILGLPPEHRMGIAASMSDLFRQSNTRFNADQFMSRAGVPIVQASRRPFVVDSRRSSGGRPRTAGETWIPSETVDSFEFPNHGKPEVTDNMKINDLPKPKAKTPQIAGIVEDYQRFDKGRADKGLDFGGDTEVDNFLDNHKAGPRAQTKLHQTLGLEPHPSAKVPGTKVGSFFTPKVAGWNWDDHLAAYVTKERRPFRCTTAGCDTEIPTPGYMNCRCGRLWNTYAIGDGQRLASGDADMYLAREIPIRENVIMANRQFEAEERANPAEENVQSDGPFQDYPEDVEFFSDDELEDAPAPHAPGETDMPTTRSAATYGDDDHNVSYRDGQAYCSACDAMLWDPNVHHCPAKQASRRQADWTVYDDDDNAGYEGGPDGPPQTGVGNTPKDWAKRGDGGKWLAPHFK